MIYYAVSGKIAMLHKKSHSYLAELIKDDYFGEIEFFSEEPRLLSARSRDFTECYTIHKRDFIHIAEDYINSIVKYSPYLFYSYIISKHTIKLGRQYWKSRTIHV